MYSRIEKGSGICNDFKFSIVDTFGNIEKECNNIVCCLLSLIWFGCFY